MKSLVTDYLALRRLIGVVALAMPAALVAGEAILRHGPLPDSISAFYYSPMRDWLVGSLWAIGAFLLTYRGYGRDWVAMKAMAISAIGVALFPAGPAPAGILHEIFAALLFGTMTLVCLFIFTRHKAILRGERLPGRKKQRNAVYLVCGSIMLAALVLVYPLTQWLRLSYSLFGLETVAIEAFSIAWIVKGQAILKDVVS